jgi:hypothetical protein
MWTGVNFGVDKSVYVIKQLAPKTPIMTQDWGFFLKLDGIIVV